MIWTEISQAISDKTHSEFELENRRSVGGGCINQAYQLIGKQKSYFLKLNRANQVEMFAAEALALEEMYNTQTIRVPQPICWGVAESNSYLVLEWLDLGRGNNQSWQEMGKKLALLHQSGGENRFGWQINNTIGDTPQINDWDDNWADFFAEQRIGYQLRLANRRGGNFNNPNLIIETVRTKLKERDLSPSLVHGDLWSGNAASTLEGEPVIIDPAVYYGDREVDIAMSELFGRFPVSFYQGYNQQWPLDRGYEERKTIYNLYHILNHFNLFGSGYASQANSMIRKILKS